MHPLASIHHVALLALLFGDARHHVVQCCAGDQYLVGPLKRLGGGLLWCRIAWIDISASTPRNRDMSNIAPTQTNQITRATEIIRTTGDVKITLSDAGPSIELQTPTGTKIMVGSASISIATQAGSIRIDGGTITIDAAQIRLESPMVTARILRCDTLIADMVVASSYTPGAGNIW